MPKINGLSFSTDREIQNLKPQDKRYSVKDKLNNGLFIEVKESGVKSWHYRYSLNGKQERLVIGRYPDLSLKDARQVRDESASMVAKGISPKKEKNDKKIGNSNSIRFKDYGERYLNEVISKDRKSTYNMMLCLKNDIYPLIGELPLKLVTVDEVRKVIWRKKDQGYDAAANQVRGLLKRMLDYAVTLGMIQFNPVLSIPTRHVCKAKPRDRFLTEAEIKDFYTAVFTSRIYKARKYGLLLSLLTLVRKSELLKAKWEHVDFVNKTWLIPETKGDGNSGHSREMIVYMSDQTISILNALKVIAGNEPYVFVGRKSGTHISHNAFNTAQKNVLKLTTLPPFTIHDLRRTASTHLHEQGFNTDVIEASLNHTIKGVRGVYNKASYKKQRIDMLQKWSDYIYDLIGSIPLIK
ncbi:tyrosine-type recombinase/integrase [Acinetobacter sp. YH12201]|uniref:tyrosine-type recombinase/integrase n=1 Tax=Acinetobacter sp. YH12201 TaxID=2601140 RepID=UPI0015D27053|nr:tyrosine-type recombinase/integrase [Acinetobacter sp. YH12201]